MFQYIPTGHIPFYTTPPCGIRRGRRVAQMACLVLLFLWALLCAGWLIYLALTDADYILLTGGDAPARIENCPAGGELSHSSIVLPVSPPANRDCPYVSACVSLFTGSRVCPIHQPSWTDLETGRAAAGTRPGYFRGMA